MGRQSSASTEQEGRGCAWLSRACCSGSNRTCNSSDVCPDVLFIRLGAGASAGTMQLCCTSITGLEAHSARTGLRQLL